jgi:uncharacterized protein (TIGR02145 family)
MWVYDSEYKKWISNDDYLNKENYEFFKQELSAVRFYSKCLSGATFMPINSTSNLYDIISNYIPRNWFIGINGSQYSNTLIPSISAKEINDDTSYEYYTKYLTEDAMSLKTLFTPKRLIDDSINNFIYVDVATINQIEINFEPLSPGYGIDGVTLKEGHKVLIKDQRTTVTLPNTVDPDVYFLGDWEALDNVGATIDYVYYNEQNGIYEVKNGILERTNTLDDYDNCKRFSVIVKMGVNNRERQFHLNRLKSGYFPTTQRGEPIEFVEKRNWMLRNRVDYNNLFEINYYDVIKHNDQQYYFEGVTYSIPERIISVGEFGIIHNNQKGVSNIIRNKYKVNLRGITETSTYYWICGDSGILLKVRKHDFEIQKVDLVLDNYFSIRLKSVSFYNDLRGAVVGDLNTIYITEDGGYNWQRLRIPDFDSFYFNKVVFSRSSSFFVGGNVGVFIEMVQDINGWSALRRRISKFIDDDDEYQLVDNINDMYYTKMSTWGLSFSYSTQSVAQTKELLFIVADDNKIIVHDIEDANGKFDFLYLDFGRDYDDILNITRRNGTNTLYFTGTNTETSESGLFSFSLDNFQYIGVGNSYSNTILTTVPANLESTYFPNEIFDFAGQEMLIAGNESLLYSSFYEQGSSTSTQSIIVNYGGLYNWYSISGFDPPVPNIDGRELGGIVNLTQPDWIVPSDNDWQDLSNYLISNVGGKIKATSSWNSPNTGSTNESGFSAIPGGLISSNGTTASVGPGAFGNGAWFHSSSTGTTTSPAYVSTTASYWYVTNTSAQLTNFSGDKGQGLSIRLVRPTTTLEDLLPDGTWILNAYQGNDGKNYYGVKIGTQLWLAENLKETLNNQGFSISQLFTGSSTINWVDYDGLETPAFNNFNNNQVSATASLEQSVYTPTSNIFNFDVLDPNFENKLKSKLIFLDYDAGSKQNFFTDFGEYRLPNSASFSSLGLTGVTSSISFSPIINVASFPSYVTQSETNWWTYWTDRELTFEYYAIDDLFKETRKVLINSTFSYSAVQTEGVFSINSNPAYQLLIAPSTLIPNGSRYNGLTAATNSTFPTGQPLITDSAAIPDGIHIYDYLMIIKTNNTYPVSKGDIIKFSSTYVEGSFMVNKIVNGFAGKQLIYLYTDFNNNIVNTFTYSSYTASIVNLNKYKTVQELESRFNMHPISNGYSMDYDPGLQQFIVDAEFNYFSAYYNLATTVTVNDYEKVEMKYTEGFLNFGYTPTYNLLSYLEGLNDVNSPDPIFFADKEYYSMPEYRAVPLSGVGSLTSTQCYIDYNGITYSSVNPAIPFSTSNKLLFGADLKLEWDSILINTYVDLYLYGGPSDPGNWPSVSPTSISEKMLVMKKYYDETQNAYVIEFNKRINHVLNQPQYWIDIVSRRKLKQISDDLQEMNNIQRPKRKKQELTASGMNVIGNGHDYWIYEREMNQKISTNSYLKILLSDVETFENISGIIYTDYKNELALNITKLEQKFEIPIKSTGNYLGNLFIFCSKKHGLKDEDGVVLEFTGGELSSEFLNQDYFGYHTVKVVNEYNFYVNHPYGNIPSTGQDIGFVKYTRIDPFLNFAPVDIIDIGVDKKGKQSVELTTENTDLVGSIYKLINVDFNKYRFRLIDGLDLGILSQVFPWILEAEISGATIGLTPDTQLIWYKGVWECGRWFGGRWISGTWVSGDWYDGTWESKRIKDNKLNIQIFENSTDEVSSKWFGGRWFGGTWNNGTWLNGRWYGGTWNNGRWFKGLWNDGVWNYGEFSGGIWILGTWNNGVFNTNSEPAYWLDGDWNGGDFENGIWYNGYFTEKTNTSRFGVNSYNSRTSIWHGGNWISGQFHSRLNINDDGLPSVCDVHRYSIWYTGNWFDGEFYGGVAYSMDWKSGTWHGGILEDIEIIGFGTDGPGRYYFTLNGIFKFNNRDKITVIDNQFGNQYSSLFGSNKNRKTYTILDTEELTDLKYTKVYVASIISITDGAPNLPGFDTTLKVVSKFGDCNWKTGIWTNGIFEKGLWEGGIWYNGIFQATWM